MVTWLHRKRYSLTVKEDGHGKVALYDLTVTMCQLVKYRKNNKT